MSDKLGTHRPDFDPMLQGHAAVAFGKECHRLTSRYDECNRGIEWTSCGIRLKHISPHSYESRAELLSRDESLSLCTECWPEEVLESER